MFDCFTKIDKILHNSLLHNFINFCNIFPDIFPDNNNGSTLIGVERESYFTFNFAARRIIKRKKMYEERNNDEQIIDPEKRFEIQVYNVIYDNAFLSLEKKIHRSSKIIFGLEEIDHLPEDSFQDITDQIIKNNCDHSRHSK